MGRQKPVAVLEHVEKTRMQQVIQRDALYIVTYKSLPIDVKWIGPINTQKTPAPVYLKTTFYSKKSAENLARKLNAIHGKIFEVTTFGGNTK